MNIEDIPGCEDVLIVRTYISLLGDSRSINIILPLKIYLHFRSVKESETDAFYIQYYSLDKD